MTMAARGRRSSGHDPPGDNRCREKNGQPDPCRRAADLERHPNSDGGQAARACSRPLEGRGSRERAEHSSGCTWPMSRPECTGHDHALDREHDEREREEGHARGSRSDPGLEGLPPGGRAGASRGHDGHGSLVCLGHRRHRAGASGRYGSSGRRRRPRIESMKDVKKICAATTIRVAARIASRVSLSAPKPLAAHRRRRLRRG